jgi:hypothetical protein
MKASSQMATETLPRFAGHSDDQVARILSEIAGGASILVETLRDYACGGEGSESTLHAAVAVAQKIGMLADSTTDMPVLGDYKAWMLGGNIDELGTMAKGGDHA